jgi:hypothetical protein
MSLASARLAAARARLERLGIIDAEGHFAAVASPQMQRYGSI